MNQSDKSQEFRDWLKQRREELGLSEQKMAELIDINIGAYMIWEVGNPPHAPIPLEYIQRIEAICGQFRSPEEVENEPNHNLRQAETSDFLGEIADSYSDGECDRCHTTLEQKDRYCPECGRAQDNH